jgi:hypothetical protein
MAMPEFEDTVRTISALVTGVIKNPTIFGKLSTTEGLAVGMVLDRRDMIDNRSMLSAACRLGPQWLEAAYEVQCQLGQDEKTLGQRLFKSENAV